MDELKIELGVPIPPRKGKTGITEALRQLKVGESVLYAGSRTAIYTYARAKGIKITVRTEGNGIRIWRVA